jgi:hypothetical protein
MMQEPLKHQKQMAQAQILDMLCLEKVQKWINQAHEMPVVRPEQAEVAYCLRYGTTLPPTTMPGVCCHPGKPAKLYTGSRHSEGKGGKP